MMSYYDQNGTMDMLVPEFTGNTLRMLHHYKNLEVTECSSKEQIKQSYHRLCKLYHPDVYKQDDNKFRMIKDSYEWLIKNHKPKINYDNEPYYILRTYDHNNPVYEIDQSLLNKKDVIIDFIFDRVLIKKETRLPYKTELNTAPSKTLITIQHNTPVDSTKFWGQFR